MLDRLTVTLPSRIEYRSSVEALLQRVCALMEPRGAGPWTHQILSAFNEAFNNVVLHAYDSRSDGLVEVEILRSAREVVITLADRGRSFDMNGVPEPDLRAMPEGGMGVYIIKKSMDEVRYSSEHGRNALTMIKRVERDLTSHD